MNKNGCAERQDHVEDVCKTNHCNVEAPMDKANCPAPTELLPCKDKPWRKSCTEADYCYNGTVFANQFDEFSLAGLNGGLCFMKFNNGAVKKSHAKGIYTVLNLALKDAVAGTTFVVQCLGKTGGNETDEMVNKVHVMAQRDGKKVNIDDGMKKAMTSSIQKFFDRQASDKLPATCGGSVVGVQVLAILLLTIFILSN